MHQHRITLDLGSPADGVVTEFRVFRIGENTSTKGTFLLAADDCRKIAADWARRGLDCSIDYEHKAWSFLSPDSTAAGWCTVEARGDGLWCTDVRWTEAAAAKLRAREYRYFSPAFEVSEDDPPRITRLLNVALTNIPALDQIEPLAASQVEALAASIAARVLASLTPKPGEAMSDETPAPAARPVALALGLDAEASEATILETCSALRSQAAELDTLRARVAGFEQAERDRATAEAQRTVAAAVADGRVPEGAREQAERLCLSDRAAFEALFPVREKTVPAVLLQSVAGPGGKAPERTDAKPVQSHSDQAHERALALLKDTPTLTYEAALTEASRLLAARS